MEKLCVYDENLKEVEIKSDDKLVVINLWAIWCGYCKEELADFNEIYKEYKDDIKLYMVCSIKDKNEIEGVRKYIDEKGYEFEVYFDIDDKLIGIYKTVGYPTTVYLDKDLSTLAKNVGALSKDRIIKNIQKYR